MNYTTPNFKYAQFAKKRKNQGKCFITRKRENLLVFLGLLGRKSLRIYGEHIIFLVIATIQMITSSQATFPYYIQPVTFYLYPVTCFADRSFFAQQFLILSSVTIVTLFLTGKKMSQCCAEECLPCLCNKSDVTLGCCKNYHLQKTRRNWWNLKVIFTALTIRFKNTA